MAIAGPPNAGKSSLLNRLAGYDAAIVTDIPGTTRDPLREHLTLDGLAVTIVDTAGLRESADPVEQEGLRRARVEVGRADRVLWVVDVREPLDASLAAARANLGDAPFTLLRNKLDLMDDAARAGADLLERSAIGATRTTGATSAAGTDRTPVLAISALTGAGYRRADRASALGCRLQRATRPAHSARGAAISRRSSAPRARLVAARAELGWRARARGRRAASGASGARRAHGRAHERRLARRNLRDVLHRQVAEGSTRSSPSSLRPPSNVRPLNVTAARSARHRI